MRGEGYEKESDVSGCEKRERERELRNEKERKVSREESYQEISSGGRLRLMGKEDEHSLANFEERRIHVASTQSLFSTNDACASCRFEVSRAPSQTITRSSVQPVFSFFYLFVAEAPSRNQSATQ